jgi:tRNA(adenine34) deaminase
MAAAVECARDAVELGEIGIAALVLDSGGICVAARHDEVRSSGDPTRHAVLLSLRDAAAAWGTWRLVGARLVVTKEPCPLCAGAALAARVSRVLVGAVDELVGCLGSRYNLAVDPRLNHEFAVESGILADAADAVYRASIDRAPQR